MTWAESIEQHYTQKWMIKPETCPFSMGPIHQLPLGFRVVKFPPHPRRRMWTYATCGMSLPTDTSGLELHLFSPVQSDALVELLFAVAHFHHNNPNLDLWHTVNFGRPWLNSSLCSFGLISLPYLDGPELENFKSAKGSIKFYWLIPITSAELRLKQSDGIEALEAKFDASGFNYADPERESIA